MRKSAPFLLAVIVFVLDQLSKFWIRANYSLSFIDPKVAGFFNLVHAENPGAAFSMFAEASPFIRKGLLVGMALVIVILLILALLDRIRLVETQFARMALGLVLGGACGNLLDRIYAGTVTDFLEFYWRNYYFPAFNLADTAIFCGACLMVLDYWFGTKIPVEQTAKESV